MGNAILRYVVGAQLLAQALKDESGLEPAEYALVVAVAGLGAIAAVGTLANGVNMAMSRLFGNLIPAQGAIA